MELIRLEDEAFPLLFKALAYSLGIEKDILHWMCLRGSLIFLTSSCTFYFLDLGPRFLGSSLLKLVRSSTKASGWQILMCWETSWRRLELSPWPYSTLDCMVSSIMVSLDFSYLVIEMEGFIVTGVMSRLLVPLLLVRPNYLTWSGGILLPPIWLVKSMKLDCAPDLVYLLL